MSYDAIVFDNDGIITTCTDRTVLRSAIADTFDEFGVKHPAPEHFDALLTISIEQLEEICRTYDLEKEEFWYARDANAAAVQCAEIDAGRKTLHEDVEILKRIDANMAVVSNNQHETVSYIMEFFDLDGLFATYYGREPSIDGIHRKKPSSYYLDRALEELNATNGLYVGDSRVDVIAAERAGIDSVFVRRSHRREYVLDCEPTYELDSLRDLPGIVSSGPQQDHYHHARTKK